MTKILQGLVVAILLFAAGAAGSWYLIQSRTAPVGQGSEPAAPPSATTTPPQEMSPAGTAASPSAPNGEPEEMPVSLRSQPMTAEDVFRFGAAIRRRRELLETREKEISVEEDRLRLMRDDLEEQQRSLEGMLVQIHDALSQAERLLAQLQEARAQLEGDRQKMQQQLDEVQKAQSTLTESQQGNLKQISGWFQSMAPETAAQLLRELSNNGQMDSVVQLLSYLEEREAARILGAIQDPDLVAQLMEKFTNMRRPPKPSRR